MSCQQCSGGGVPTAQTVSRCCSQRGASLSADERISYVMGRQHCKRQVQCMRKRGVASQAHMHTLNTAKVARRRNTNHSLLNCVHIVLDRLLPAHRHSHACAVQQKLFATPKDTTASEAERACRAVHQ